VKSREGGQFVIKSPAFGPEIFRADAIASETLAFNEKLRRASSDAPARTEIPLALEREMPPGGGLLPRVNPRQDAEIRDIPGPAGALPIRILRPQHGRVKGLYVHFHGGGFCLGAASHHDDHLSSLADHAEVVTISVDYRLAPEHPYPAGPADAEAAAWWATTKGTTEFGVDKVVLGGESAGATLAAMAALRLRNRRGYDGLAGLNLSQGIYDFSMTPSLRRAIDTLVINKDIVRQHLERFLGKLSSEEATHPNLSVLYADLKGMPPALFTIGTLDALLDDTLFLYMRWLAAGAEARLDIYPGGVHGFHATPTQLGVEARSRVEQFVAERCHTLGS
jgi:acetyl esterase/lipase